MVPFPPESTAGFFCSLHCENPVNLEINSQKCMGPLEFSWPLDFPPSSSSSSSVQTFLPLCWFPWRFLLVCFFSNSDSCDSVLHAYLSLQFREEQFALWLYFSEGSEKSWVFSLFNFLFVGRMEWRSVCTCWTETGSPSIYFHCLHHLYYLRNLFISTSKKRQDIPNIAFIKAVII